MPLREHTPAIAKNDLRTQAPASGSNTLQRTRRWTSRSTAAAPSNTTNTQPASDGLQAPLPTSFLLLLVRHLLLLAWHLFLIASCLSKSTNSSRYLGKNACMGHLCLHVSSVNKLPGGSSATCIYADIKPVKNCQGKCSHRCTICIASTEA